MVTKTEGRHAASFILSEANGQQSRANGLVGQGQNLAAGEVIEVDDDGLIVSFTGATDGEGALIRQAAGILIEAIGATTAERRVAYIARVAEYNEFLIIYPPGTRVLTLSSLYWCGAVDDAGSLIPRGNPTITFRPTFPRPET